jgi:hypothetical protein
VRTDVWYLPDNDDHVAALRRIRDDVNKKLSDQQAEESGDK